MTAESTRPITIAIAALGGQGGGVLTGWIVDMAEHEGYLAQSTSVPGVAQRTGATIYCVELFAESAARAAGADPVLALMPVPGDVDIVIAAEMLEAGRAIQRGFVTPELTTLIASSHRMYAVIEKAAMGDGTMDQQKVADAAAAAAKSFICFDMDRVAADTGSVISSVLFGALCASKALPFERPAFEEAIRRSGIAVETNLAGFSKGYEGALADTVRTKSEERASGIGPGEAKSVAANALLRRISDTFPEPCRETIVEGVKRLVDYQDPRYAGLYLDRLEKVLGVDRAAGPEAYSLSRDTARHLALWMSYEDTIRVADLKTRSSRFERFRQEVRAADDQLVYVSEFMHPRVEEICDTLPAGLGRYLMTSKTWRSIIGRFCRKGRQVRTTTVSGFLLLHILAGFKRWRRSTLRFKREDAAIDEWLGRIEDAAPRSYALACEIAKCQRLIKGYSDTHERGSRNFQRIMSAIDSLGVSDETAAEVGKLREAALADEEGAALNAALEKVA